MNEVTAHAILTQLENQGVALGNMNERLTLLTNACEILKDCVESLSKAVEAVPPALRELKGKRVNVCVGGGFPPSPFDDGDKPRSLPCHFCGRYVRVARNVVDVLCDKCYSFEAMDKAHGMKPEPLNPADSAAEELNREDEAHERGERMCTGCGVFALELTPKGDGAQLCATCLKALDKHGEE